MHHNFTGTLLNKCMYCEISYTSCFIQYLNAGNNVIEFAKVLDWANKNVSCLTDEEIIIKNIIE